MIVIGVTGGVGTGKSTVSRILGDLGAEVINADHLAHQMILPGGPAYAELVEAFGEGILDADGTGAINRRELGRRAFADPALGRLINSIVHPHVIAAIEERITRLRAADRPPPALVLDVPLLYESGLDAICDVVWVVFADPDVRRARVEARDGQAAGEITLREDLQMPMSEKMTRAGAVIDNSGPEDETKGIVKRLWSNLPA